MPIALNSDLAADHYTGTVALTATVPDSAVGAVLKSDGTLTLENLAIATLPLTTDVRAAAVWPFLILLFIEAPKTKAWSCRSKLLISLVPEHRYA